MSFTRSYCEREYLRGQEWKQGPGWVTGLEFRPIHEKCEFDSWSGCTPKLRVQSPIRACTEGN